MAARLTLIFQGIKLQVPAQYAVVYAVLTNGHRLGPGQPLCGWRSSIDGLDLA